MTRWLALMALAALAACGADGEPLRPDAPQLRGSIGLGSSGVSTSAQVSTRIGPVTVSAGL